MEHAEGPMFRTILAVQYSTPILLASTLNLEVLDDFLQSTEYGVYENPYEIEAS